MVIKPIKIFPLICACILYIGTNGIAQDTYGERHIEVVLRMIGHQVLLNANDSTSLVLPIERENDQFRISFGTEFELNPEELVTIVSSVAQETKLAGGYIVEVEKCGTDEVVYSYEIGELEKTDLVACKQRALPKSCYSLLFTLMETGNTHTAWNGVNPEPSNEALPEPRKVNYGLLAVPFVLVVGLFFMLWKKKHKPEVDSNMIALGKFRFNKRNAELQLEQQKIELSHKEAELLMLLYNAVNTTVEREHILNVVWEDEGDYVGRTLDVFISKLRKKLEADPSVKIVNIRGVGYKLVLEE